MDEEHIDGSTANEINFDRQAPQAASLLTQRGSASSQTKNRRLTRRPSMHKSQPRGSGSSSPKDSQEKVGKHDDDGQ